MKNILLFLSFLAFILPFSLSAQVSPYSERKSRALERHLLHKTLPLYNTPRLPSQPNQRYIGGIPVDFQSSSFQFNSQINSFLSTACAQGQFNQFQVNHFVVSLQSFGKFEKNVGFASSRGLNLRDPKGLAQEGFFYLFDFDGTSSCRVAIFQE